MALRPRPPDGRSSVSAPEALVAERTTISTNLAAGATWSPVALKPLRPLAASDWLWGTRISTSASVELPEQSCTR